MATPAPAPLCDITPRAMASESRSPWASDNGPVCHGDRCGERLRGCQAVIVGAGSSGRAAARLLTRTGARVRVVDKSETGMGEEFAAYARQADIELCFGEHTPGQFEDADLVVLSPGVPKARIAPLLPTDPGPEVVAEMELASWFVSEPILAVTGTNGKTTTVSLAAAMLAYAGRKVFVGGNIGTPLSEYVLDGLHGEKADILVLEVSSFQLQTCISFKPWAAALLNFSDNHLDYHADMEEYLSAKLNLFAHMDEDGLAVFPAAQREELERRNPTRARVVWYAPHGRFDAGPLAGPHNAENMEAAYQLARYFGVTECEAQAAIHRFEPLAHRMEPVATVRGVRFVNDSKGTTVEAVRAALASFENILLLAGGVYKGGDLGSLAPLVRERVKRVALFGKSRERFEAAWNGAAAMTWDESLEQAARRLFAEAREGDVILLSPATSSFDQYPNFVARGEDFRRIAKAIEEEEGHESA